MKRQLIQLSEAEISYFPGWGWAGPGVQNRGQAQLGSALLSFDNFEPNPYFNPKMRFFHFCKLLILWMRCHQNSSVAVCVELTEFLDNIFNMPIFKPKLNFFEILKANMVKHPEMVMTI